MPRLKSYKKLLYQREEVEDVWQRTHSIHFVNTTINDISRGIDLPFVVVDVVLQ